MRRIYLLVPAFAALAACSPYNPDLPSQPFLCGNDSPQCPDGFTCMTTGSASVCISDHQVGGPDGGGSSTDCSADSQLEPNDDFGHAWEMPVDDPKKVFNLAGLTICPSGDIDNYGFVVNTEGENAAVTLTYDPDGTPLQLSVLVQGGSNGATQIINGAAVSGMPGVVKASPSNLSQSQYYISVFGPTSGGTNDYELSIEISGP